MTAPNSPFPGDDVLRSIEEIAPEEIELAVLYLVEQSFGIARESVPAGVVRLFGVERARSEAAATIQGIVDDLIDRGRLRLSGLTLYLPWDGLPPPSSSPALVS